ncbi:MAG: hypothetical protein O7C03_07520, partial [Gammaproteobacteria bacterium]|nr:hypothetical protein [Gammaproteobacteria bacterium]
QVQRAAQFLPGRQLDDDSLSEEGAVERRKLVRRRVGLWQQPAGQAWILAQGVGQQADSVFGKRGLCGQRRRVEPIDKHDADRIQVFDPDIASVNCVFSGQTEQPFLDNSQPRVLTVLVTPAGQAGIQELLHCLRAHLVHEVAPRGLRLTGEIVLQAFDHRAHALTASSRNQS